MQQLNALNYELELLKQQLTKINRLLNDTIVEKTKKEINLQAIELHNNQQNNLDSMQNFKMKTYFNSNNDLVPPANDPIRNKSIQRENSDHQVHVGRNSFNSKDLVREKRRASIGRTSNYATHMTSNHNNHHVFNDNSNFSSVQMTNANNSNHNSNKISAMERLFGSQRNIEQLIMNKPEYRKIAHVKPEIRNDERFIQRIISFCQLF